MSLLGRTLKDRADSLQLIFETEAGLAVCVLECIAVERITGAGLNAMLRPVPLYSVFLPSNLHDSRTVRPLRRL